MFFPGELANVIKDVCDIKKKKSEASENHALNLQKIHFFLLRIPNKLQGFPIE